jgi:lipase chaperone LimK
VSARAPEVVVAGLLAIALAAVGLHIQSDSGGGSPVPRSDTSPPPQPSAAPAPFVPSMAGTRPDGSLRAPSGGALTIDAELRHLFDYYLSALGEAELPAIRAGIEQELTRRLQPAAAAEAIRLLGQYLAYKRALADADRAAAAAPGASSAAAARTRLQAMLALRRQFFSPTESAGLFGDSDARDLDAIARLELMGDKALTPAQRQQKLAELDRRLPIQLQAEREAPLRVLKLEQQVDAARAGGAGEDDIFRLRAAALDPQAAARLAQLDQEQAAWQRRIAAYRAQSSRMGGDPAALQRLRDNIFTPEEQKRLGAYE